MYYKVSIKIGHVGAGKSHEVVRYLQAQDMSALLDSLREFPGMKKKPGIEGISSIKTISLEEYDAGKICEWKRDYILKNLKKMPCPPNEHEKKPIENS